MHHSVGLWENIFRIWFPSRMQCIPNQTSRKVETIIFCQKFYGNCFLEQERSSDGGIRATRDLSNFRSAFETLKRTKVVECWHYLKNWLQSQRSNNNEMMEGVKTWLSSLMADFFADVGQHRLQEFHHCIVTCSLTPKPDYRFVE
jgi:hypothetical protein